MLASPTFCCPSQPREYAAARSGSPLSRDRCSGEPRRRADAGVDGRRDPTGTGGHVARCGREGTGEHVLGRVRERGLADRYHRHDLLRGNRARRERVEEGGVLSALKTSTPGTAKPLEAATVFTRLAISAEST